MLGLGFPQLILILAGICFMLAGVYGLAPSLVTAMFSGRGAAPSEKQQQTAQLTKKQQKAERARQHAEKVKAEAAAKAAREQAEAAARAEREEAEAAVRAEQERIEATRRAEQERVEAEKKKIEAEREQAAEEKKQAAQAAAAPVRVATFAPLTAPLKIAPAKKLEPEATFTPPAGSVRLADVIAPEPQPQPAPQPIASGAPVESGQNSVDTELVEELFAEMFALRSTVADLVGEVHQLRDEQKPRRFVIEELRS